MSFVPITEDDLEYWPTEEEVAARRKQVFEQTGITISDAIPAVEDSHKWEALAWSPIES